MMTTPSFGRWLLWIVLLCVAPSVRAGESAGGDSGGRAGERSYTFKRGVNISHWLSQNEGAQTYAAAWFGESDVAWIAQQGFDHIRLPVDVRDCLKSDGTFDDAKLRPVADVISWGKQRGLGTVLDAHFLPGADFNLTGGDKRVYTDEALQAKVAAVWRELARRYANEGPWLRFEILNEPVAAENAQLNPFMHRMLAAIRESNPTRTVYVTSNKWSQFATVADVVLPDDAHLALTLHTYEPMAFTHQRAPWVGFRRTLPPVRFPGTVPELTGHVTENFGTYIHAGDALTVAQVKESFARVDAWLKTHAPTIEVYVGEFGVFEAADDESARRWISLIVEESGSRGWGWAVWDYNDSFGVRNKDGSGTRILDGLFKK